MKSNNIIERTIEMDVRKQIERLFEEKKRKLKVEATLELNFIKDIPIIGASVYGEAFPVGKKIVLDVFAPDATTKEIAKILGHELVHIKYPELKEDSKELEEKIRECLT